MRRLFLLCCLLLLCPAVIQAESGTHHELSIRMDPRTGTMIGTDRLSGDATKGGSFGLADGFVVDRLLVEGEPLDASAHASRWTIPVTAEAKRVEVTYRGQVGVAEETLALVAGTGWYPTFADEAVTYDLEVEVPRGYLAVATGRLVSEDETQKAYRAHFESDVPGEGVSVFIGPYERKERMHGRLRLRTYLHRDVADLADLYLTKTAGYVDLYEKQIGEYPYSAFYFVSAVSPVGLGFPGLTYMGKQVLRLPFIPDTSLGHEVLHSWWGNGVFTDASLGNWAEGLTTFMADYAYAERKGTKEALEMRMRWLREYAALPAESDRPLSSFRSRQHAESQTVGYHKAAMVFFMLREKVGRDVFGKGVRGFWERRRFQPATWRDLQIAFEAAAGKGLEPFFSQWLERTGAPALRIESAGRRKVDGGYEVILDLAQSLPVYRLDVPVEITTTSRTVSYAVPFDVETKKLTFRTDDLPTHLRVDPRFELFRRLDPSEFAPILRNVTFASRPIAMIATADAPAAEASRAVATAFFEETPEFTEANEVLPTEPILIVGTRKEVASLLARYALPEARLSASGSALVWAARRPDGGPYAVVQAEDAEALRQLTGPLPHYGSQSFLVFQGRQAVERGVWPATDSSMHVAFDDRSGKLLTPTPNP